MVTELEFKFWSQGIKPALECEEKPGTKAIFLKQISEETALFPSGPGEFLPYPFSFFSQEEQQNWSAVSPYSLKKDQLLWRHFEPFSILNDISMWNQNRFVWSFSLTPWGRKDWIKSHLFGERTTEFSTHRGCKKETSHARHCEHTQGSGESLVSWLWGSSGLGAGSSRTRQACCHFWGFLSVFLYPSPRIKKILSLTHLGIGPACHSGWHAIIRITSIKWGPTTYWALCQLLQIHRIVLSLLKIPFYILKRHDPHFPCGKLKLTRFIQLT